MSISPCRLAELGLVTDGAVRLAPLLGLPRLIADHGLDSDAVIREVGCDPTLFSNPENTIDHAAVGRLLAHTAAVTGQPYPGLELGRHLGLRVLGVLGEALRFAPDLGTALNALMLHFHLHDRGAAPSLWESNGNAMFGYTLFCPEATGTVHIYDAAMVIARNVLSELAGKQWKIAEVHLFRDPPEQMELFRRSFRAPLRFGAEHSAVVFPSADLTRPLPRANAVAYAGALRKLEGLEGFSDAKLLKNKVSRLLHRLLITGSGPAGIHLKVVAGLFAVHPRTLNRRLRAEGTTFNTLLAEARYEVARQLLRDTRMQIADIAIVLGYAESAAFNHAFRRWSGFTATAWRAKNSAS
jgi:AraC-like DNA-binding protein